MYTIDTTRRKYCKNPKAPKPNIKALQNPDVTKKYTECVTIKLQSSSIDTENTSTITERIVKALESAIEETLSPKPKNEKESELWKNDEMLNELLEKRSNLQRNTTSYKTIHKKIKKHVRHLRNIKLKQEAEEINIHATNREIEELFRCVKSDSSAFRSTKQNNKCEPEKLTKHFKQHFSLETEIEEPVELKEIPEFI